MWLIVGVRLLANSAAPQSPSSTPARWGLSFQLVQSVQYPTPLAEGLALCPCLMCVRTDPAKHSYLEMWGQQPPQPPVYPVYTPGGVAFRGGGLSVWHCVVFPGEGSRGGPLLMHAVVLPVEAWSSPCLPVLGVSLATLQLEEWNYCYL